MPRAAHPMLVLAALAVGHVAFGQDVAPADTPAVDPTARVPSSGATDARPPSPNRMTFRSLRASEWSRAPFATVPPADKGYSSVIDVTTLPYFSTSWEALLSYWSSRGFVADDYRLLLPGRSFFFQDNAGFFREADTLSELLITDRPLLQFNRPVFRPTSSDFFNGTAFGTSFGFGNRFGFGTRFGSGFDYGLYYDYFSIGGSRSTWGGPPLVELPRIIDWNLFLEQPPEAEPEPVDPAEAALLDEAWTRAGAIYLARDQRRDIESDDRTNLRLAAIMFALDGQIERAARDLATALADQPGLRDTPVDGAALGLPKDDLRTLQARVGREANRTGDPELWALAATLADARGSSTAPRAWRRHDMALESRDASGSADR